jgi:hypothetical protein
MSRLSNQCASSRSDTVGAATVLGHALLSGHRLLARGARFLNTRKT